MTIAAPAPPRVVALPVFAMFAAFGAFWGTWGAAIPRIREQAGIDNAQLGVALLFIGAGALPAMLLAGRAADRWGVRTAAVVVAAMGLAGFGVALFANGFAALCAGLVLVGAASGAADVAINAMAARSEVATARPVITRAHGVFSSFVVLASLGTGALTGAGLPVSLPFASVAAACVIAGLIAVRGVTTTAAAPVVSVRAPSALVVPLLLVGSLAALAFASENAHQSWSAVFLEDEIGTGAGFSAFAPAVFAAVIAVTRFAIGAVRPERALTVIVVGAAAAAAGAYALSIAHTVPVAALGLGVAAAGTGVLFPTVIGIVSRRVDEARRGRAISLVTTVSYLGYLLGPVYVGVLADAVGLRGAMLGVAGLGLALLLTAPVVLRWVGRR